MNYAEVVKAAKEIRPLLHQLLGADAPGVAVELERLLEGAAKGEAGAEKRILQLLAKHRATREWLARYSAPASKATVRRSAKPPAPAGQPPSQFARVKIFYATDRKATGDPAPARFYSGECADSEELAFGTCEVSIPARHVKGELESPSLLRFEFRADPGKHVALLAVSPVARDSFFQDVAGMVRQARLKDAFVFVHGYNVSFEDAARRTAQLAHDLPFSGAPILYSWPSRARALSYKRDENSVEWSTPHLRLFLFDLAARTGAQVIHLIAHSMGNRAVTRALESIAAQTPIAARFHQVVLTAPDIDARVFRQLVPRMAPAAERITLYASSQDKALLASRRFNGEARAGDAGRGLVVMPGLETIDATSVDTSLLGHSYFGENRTVLADLFQVLRGDSTADRASDLRPARSAMGDYWEFKA